MVEFLIGLWVGGIFGGGTFAVFNDGHKGLSAVAGLAILLVWPFALLGGLIFLLCGKEFE
jgi:hypothetical protein